MIKLGYVALTMRGPRTLPPCRKTGGIRLAQFHIGRVATGLGSLREGFLYPLAASVPPLQYAPVGEEEMVASGIAALVVEVEWPQRAWAVPPMPVHSEREFTGLDLGDGAVASPMTGSRRTGQSWFLGAIFDVATSITGRRCPHGVTDLARRGYRDPMV